jgi:hypothetical protein
MIPPKWHGWLSGQYDDVPAPDSDSFRDAFFEKPAVYEKYLSSNKIYIPRQTIFNVKALEHYKARRDRYAAEW